MPTWRDLYHEEIDTQARLIRRAREIGQTWLKIAGRTVDPTRMDDRQIREVATREAERIVNYTINQENEARRKAGKPDEVICESID